MSILSEINRISENVEDALDAIEEKGVTIPSGANSNDLAYLISQIDTGGGVGGIMQDEDGYLVLSPDRPGASPSGGLEYESGTWTPSADTADAWISFVNTHTTAPCIYTINDVTESSPSTYSIIHVSYFNVEQLFGVRVYKTTGAFMSGRAAYYYKGSTESSFSSSTADISYSITNSGDEYPSYPRYWAKETEIRAYTNGDNRYWRASRTYKWIAVWAPST